MWKGGRAKSATVGRFVRFEISSTCYTLHHSLTVGNNSSTLMTVIIPATIPNNTPFVLPDTPFLSRHGTPTERVEASTRRVKQRHRHDQPLGDVVNRNPDRQRDPDGGVLRVGQVGDHPFGEVMDRDRRKHGPTLPPHTKK